MGGLLYEGVAAELREMVATLPPGERLPSEAQLMDELSATRSTVRAALQLLEREGLVIGAQGRGWLVRQSDPVQWLASRPERNVETEVKPSDAWARGVREQGREPSEHLEVAILEADPPVAKRLGLTDNPHVVVRRRLRSVDGVINNSNDTHYPQELVHGTPIASPGDVVPGVYAVLEDLGRGWKRWRDEKTARPATMAEAARFGVSVGEPMMETIRTRFDEQDRPVAVTIVVAPGDRTIDIYEGES